MRKLSFIFFILVAFKSNAQLSDFAHINFDKADSIALAYKNAPLTNLPKLTHQLTAKLNTDVEKFRAIYMWVSTNISSDYNMFAKNKRKRKKLKNNPKKLAHWNQMLNNELFEKLLKEKTTICTGYAYLIKELAALADIECKIVDGFGRTSGIDVEKLSAPNHTWNAVLLNGKWYLCDATWSSGINNSKTNEFTFDFKKGYFLAEPILFVQNHFPLNSRWMLIDGEKPSFNDFVEGPVIYGKAFQYLSKYTHPYKMYNTVRKNEKIVFNQKLLDSIDPKTVHLRITNSFIDKTVQPKTTLQENDSLTVEYQFKNNGFYDVHLMISEDMIMTYTFHVKG